MVAGAGLEPTTFGLWARRAANCSTPRYCITKFNLVLKTGIEPVRYRYRRILSPVRLPVPPLRQLLAPREGLEPSAYRLTAECSTIELPWNITWLRLTLPGGHPPSTISAKELNFCVRNGNRCILYAIITRLINLFNSYCSISTSIIIPSLNNIVNIFFHFF